MDQNNEALKLIDHAGLRETKGIPFTPKHIRDLENSGKFPKSIRLGAGRTAHKYWLESEIDAWIKDRIAARYSQAAA